MSYNSSFNSAVSGQGLEFPVLTIEASAGGLEAFNRFLTAMSADYGIALVFTSRFSPTGKSLVEQFQKYTAMPVLEAANGMLVEVNHTYVIPTNRRFVILDGILRQIGTSEGSELAMFKEPPAEQRTREINHLPNSVGKGFNPLQVLKNNEAKKSNKEKIKFWIANQLRLAGIRPDSLERKRAEERMRRQAALAQYSCDAIVGLTLTGKITDWNNGAERLFGYTAAEMTGKSFSLLSLPERQDGISQLLYERTKNPEHHFETERVRKDGKRINLSLTVSLIPDNTGAPIGVSVIARDVSERKLFEKKLLKIADEERRRIGQDLHNDLGQELAGLGFMSDTLVVALREQSAPEVKLAEKLKASIQRLVSHVQMEVWGLIPAEVEAWEFITALSCLATHISERFGIACEFICEESVSVEKNVTATNLYRIAQEAVTNAIKHGHAGHISVRLSRNQDQITLRVQDDGIGLQKQTSVNAGLGLQIMRFRAGLMNAKLDIRPVDRGGFQVTCAVNGNGR